MNTSRRGRSLWVLLITLVLASAYVIVANNNATMGAARRDAPSGFIH